MRTDKFVTPQFMAVAHVNSDRVNKKGYPPELACRGRCEKMVLAWDCVGGNDFGDEVKVSTSLIARVSRTPEEGEEDIYAVRIPHFKATLPDTEEQEALLREAATKLVYCYLVCFGAVLVASPFLNAPVQEEPFAWLGVIDGLYTSAKCFAALLKEADHETVKRANRRLSADS